MVVPVGEKDQLVVILVLEQYEYVKKVYDVMVVLDGKVWV
jgi:hypothetical protein